MNRYITLCGGNVNKYTSCLSQRSYNAICLYIQVIPSFIKYIGVIIDLLRLVSPILTVDNGLRAAHNINVSMVRDRNHYQEDVRVDIYFDTPLHMENVT